MATYSINGGTPYVSTFLGNLDPDLMLNQIPNNTAQLIVPEDVRDAIYTLWENTSLKQVSISSSSVEYMGIGGQNHTDNYTAGGDGLKLFIGKPQLSGVSVMTQSLVEYNSGDPTYPDSDIIFYNFKADDYAGGGTDQQFTKVSFLSGDPSNNLFSTAPYILSQENVGGTAIDLTIYNEGGKITIDSEDELIIGSSNTRITLLYGTGSTGIATLPGGNVGDIQINLDNCEFGAINGASASIGDVLLMGASNSPYWGELAIDNIFTLNQILTSGNESGGEDIIMTNTSSVYVGGTGPSFAYFQYNGSYNLISTNGEFRINAGSLRFDISGIGPNKVLYTDGSGYAYWATQSAGSGTPGGSNTNVQFNDSGSFSGTNLFKWITGSSSLMINSPSSNAALSVKANIDGGFFLDTNATLNGLVINDGSNDVVKLKTNLTKTIEIDPSNGYETIFGSTSSNTLGKYTFIQGTPSKHITLKSTSGEEDFRINYVAQDGHTYSSLSMNTNDGDGVFLGVYASGSKSLSLGDYGSGDPSNTNPMLTLYPTPGTVSNILGYSTAKMIIIGSASTGETPNEGLSYDTSNAVMFGVNVRPSVPFHTNGLMANQPTIESMATYNSIYNRLINPRSSTIMLGDSADQSKVLSRIGGATGSQVTAYGTRITLHNLTGDQIFINTLNGQLGAGYDPIEGRNIFFPSVTYGTVSSYTMADNRVLEMIYIPFGSLSDPGQLGNDISTTSTSTNLLSEDGVWQVIE